MPQTRLDLNILRPEQTAASNQFKWLHPVSRETLATLTVTVPVRYRASDNEYLVDLLNLDFQTTKTDANADDPLLTVEDVFDGHKFIGSFQGQEKHWTVKCHNVHFGAIVQDSFVPTQAHEHEIDEHEHLHQHDHEHEHTHTHDHQHQHDHEVHEHEHQHQHQHDHQHDHEEQHEHDDGTHEHDVAEHDHEHDTDTGRIYDPQTSPCSGHSRIYYTQSTNLHSSVRGDEVKTVSSLQWTTINSTSYLRVAIAYKQTNGITVNLEKCISATALTTAFPHRAVDIANEESPSTLFQSSHIVIEDILTVNDATIAGALARTTEKVCICDDTVCRVLDASDCPVQVHEHEHDHQHDHDHEVHDHEVHEHMHEDQHDHQHDVAEHDHEHEDTPRDRIYDPRDSNCDDYSRIFYSDSADLAVLVRGEEVETIIDKRWRRGTAGVGPVTHLEIDIQRRNILNVTSVYTKCILVTQLIIQFPLLTTQIISGDDIDTVFDSIDIVIPDETTNTDAAVVAALLVNPIKGVCICDGNRCRILAGVDCPEEAHEPETHEHEFEHEHVHVHFHEPDQPHDHDHEVDQHDHQHSPDEPDKYVVEASDCSGYSRIYNTNSDGDRDVEVYAYNSFHFIPGFVPLDIAFVFQRQGVNYSVTVTIDELNHAFNQNGVEADWSQWIQSAQWVISDGDTGSDDDIDDVLHATPHHLCVEAEINGQTEHRLITP